jgi:dnd system-associated protein 4
VIVAKSRVPPAATTRQPLRRVRRPADKEALFRKLVDEERLFETYRDLLAFTAALGYEKGRSMEFKNSLEPINWEIFRGSTAEAVVFMIAGVSKDDFNILSSDRFSEQLQIFEEFANGGLGGIQERLAAPHRPPIEVLLELVQEAEAVAEPKPRLELEKMADELSWG